MKRSKWMEELLKLLIIIHQFDNSFYKKRSGIPSLEFVFLCINSFN